MLGRTHFAAGALAGSLVNMTIGIGNPIPAMTIGAIAGLIPDIDELGSIIGKRLPFLAVPMKLIFGHRTITHTLIFCVCISLLIASLAHTWAD